MTSGSNTAAPVLQNGKKKYNSYVDVVRADVDLSGVPVSGLVHCHSRLFPLQLVVETNGQNLTNKQENN